MHATQRTNQRRRPTLLLLKPVMPGLLCQAASGISSESNWWQAIVGWTAPRSVTWTMYGKAWAWSCGFHLQPQTPNLVWSRGRRHNHPWQFFWWSVNLREIKFVGVGWKSVVSMQKVCPLYTLLPLGLPSSKWFQLFASSIRQAYVKHLAAASGSK